MTAARFGTDGIRGVVGSSLTEADAANLGRALAQRFPDAHVLVGRDTRPSGPALSAALVRALRSGGASVIDLGVLPTPGLAFLVSREPNITLGVVVTASHNPVEYNGLKVISRDGRKIADAIEREIEVLMESSNAAASESAAAEAPADHDARAALLRGHYVEHLREVAEREVPGSGAAPLTILVDAAHGAGSSYVLDALAATGAIVAPLSTSVGVINDAVGATSPGALAAAVRERGADAGIALDGDADRCVAVDERGQPVDGDVLIALLALDRHERRLAGADRVVATVLTNTAIERRLTAAGIALERTQVGDRHVAEELRRSGAGFGGEKSGHLLFPEHSPTGDGIISAIHLVGLLVRSQQPLSVLVQALPLDPQVQSSVAVGQSGAQGILENPAFIALVQEQALHLSAVGGRLVVRASGTEPLLRIMGEAPDAAIVQQVVDRVAALASRLVHEG